MLHRAGARQDARWCVTLKKEQ